MKTPMTVEEWLDKNSSKLLNNIDFAQQYSTYLLKHHLEHFAEECKISEFIKDKSIDQTLNDYLTKNGIV